MLASSHTPPIGCTNGCKLVCVIVGALLLAARSDHPQSRAAHESRGQCDHHDVGIDDDRLADVGDIRSLADHNDCRPAHRDIRLAPATVVTRRHARDRRRHVASVGEDEYLRTRRTVRRRRRPAGDRHE
jgi:hypothetical protein